MSARLPSARDAHPHNARAYDARARVLRALEVPALVLVPCAMGACAYLGASASAALTLLSAVLALLLFFASYEASRPALRQVMPATTMAAVAAAGRILFAPVPNVQPVSAIVIVAGATLGRRNGFMVGALAALASNFFFGQGEWTPWQMYAWGLMGYLAGALAATGALEHRWALFSFGFVASLGYGLLLNGFYILGYVKPLTWGGALSAIALAAPFDILHAASTVTFLALVWLPWGRSIRRVVRKYSL